MFFGTPHRPSTASWEFILSSLVQSLIQGLCGPWLPSVIFDLAVYHEKLAEEFDIVANDFKVINHYQEECIRGSYDVVSISIVNL